MSAARVRVLRGSLVAWLCLVALPSNAEPLPGGALQVLARGGEVTLLPLAEAGLGAPLRLVGCATKGALALAPAAPGLAWWVGTGDAVLALTRARIGVGPSPAAGRDGGRCARVDGLPGARSIVEVGPRIFLVTPAGALIVASARPPGPRPSGVPRFALETLRERGVRRVAADGAVLVALTDRGIELPLVSPPQAWPVKGQAIALAAAGGKAYCATREGPLYELDLATGQARDLGLGSWWATVALAADGRHLYAVTQAGKLWRIDPRAGTKTALAMEGWADAVELVVTPPEPAPPR